LLLTLQGETVRGFSSSALAETDETAGHLALHLVGAGEEGGVRATVSGGHA
jgi:hypothetical protein